MKSSVDSKFNDEKEINLKEGQEGVTISYLRPSGKAEFDNTEWEVSAHDEFIESGTKVIVEKIENRKRGKKSKDDMCLDSENTVKRVLV